MQLPAVREPHLQMRTAEAGRSHRRHRICLWGVQTHPGLLSPLRGATSVRAECHAVSWAGATRGTELGCQQPPPHWLGTSGAAGAGTPSAAAWGVHVSMPRAEPPAACCAPQTRRTDSATALLQGVGRLAAARGACWEASCELGIEGEAGPGQAET